MLQKGMESYYYKAYNNRFVLALCIVAFFSMICPSLSLAMPSSTTTTTPTQTPPIVYTIAGSDSGGGAGIQADLHAIHSFGCHGCSAITCLTAQNSVGVTSVHAPPPTFLQAQLDALLSDLPPMAVKIGMLGTKDLAIQVGNVLKTIRNDSKNNNGHYVWVVVDPVMISTSGHKLIDDEATQAMIDHVFPQADVITPNKFEAEALLGRKLQTPLDVENGAKELLKMKCKSVLIKGGHTLVETSTSQSDDNTKVTNNDDDDDDNQVASTLKYSQDYLLSSVSTNDEARLCDGSLGVWLRSTRWDTDNTHGTGCTLSSSIASALALGEKKRQIVASSTNSNHEGATSAIDIVDACCLAKAYVTAGIQKGVQLGKGPGPVVHTTFPKSHEHFPSIAISATTDFASFPPMLAHDVVSNNDNDIDDDIPRLGKILPIVDTVEWVERLVIIPGIQDIQLRIKDKEMDHKQIVERVQRCEDICKENNVRLWINDYWEAAIEAGCFGVHVGQEDLYKCLGAGGLDKLRKQNMALGVSTHSYGELAAALAVKPSYISMGPVFGTNSKKVKFDAQGLGIVTKWRQLIPPNIPFVTIGGISTVDLAKQNREAGADCVAVIGAITKADNVDGIVNAFNNAME